MSDRLIITAGMPPMLTVPCSKYNWTHPHALITTMKDGRTHLAHEAERAVDMETGAIMAVTLHGGRWSRCNDSRKVAEARESITVWWRIPTALKL